MLPKHSYHALSRFGQATSRPYEHRNGVIGSFALALYLLDEVAKSAKVAGVNAAVVENHIGLKPLFKRSSAVIDKVEDRTV